VTITFADRQNDKRALASLLGRFSSRVLASGKHLVAEAALEALASRIICLPLRVRQPMSSKWRRFEVLLPFQFNDGWDVPAEWLAEAVLEIVDHFGAAGSETQKLEGHWRQGSVVYRDDLVRLLVDVPETAPSRDWMRDSIAAGRSKAARR
jgi:hypothetical protein